MYSHLRKSDQDKEAEQIREVTPDSPQLHPQSTTNLDQTEKDPVLEENLESPQADTELPFAKLDSVYEVGRQSWIKEILEAGIGFGNAEFRQILTDIVNQPEKFLGFGGSAAVFNVGNQCVKIIRNRWKKGSKEKLYNLGRNPKDEFKIQSLINNLKVEEVFAPRTFSCLFSDQLELAAIFMERLDAVDLQDILRGKQKAPANFNPELFFEGVQSYIYTLHDEYNIIHGDIAPRNLMVDRKTGLARVIDFGRASHYPTRPSNFDQLSQIDEQGLKDLEKDLRRL